MTAFGEAAVERKLSDEVAGRLRMRPALLIRQRVKRASVTFCLYSA